MRAEALLLATAAAAFLALRALRRRQRRPPILLQVRAPGRPAPRDDTQRTVVNADAMAWMRAHPGPFPGSVVTGIPDISEVSLAPDEYRTFFLEAVELILRRTPTDGVAVFCQTDCRIMAPPSADCAVHKKCRAQVQREWLDKSHLLQLACARVPHCRLLFHKIALISEPGNRKFNKPAFSHVLAFGFGDLLLHDKVLTPDVSPRGDIVWSRGTGSTCCVHAVDFCRLLGATTIVDPFCGHGTVLAAANAAGLDALGVEISEKRCRAARNLQMAAAATSKRAARRSEARAAAPSAADDESPRARLLRRFAELRAQLPEEDHTLEAIKAAAPATRYQMTAERHVRAQLQRCDRLGLCLACGLSPCRCSAFAPLPLRGHRLWLVLHSNELLKSSNTGKLLLLAHPDAHLLVAGLPSDDEQLERLLRAPNTAVLYPAADALSPAQLRARRAADNGGAPLDILLLDGTWSETRSLARRLPPETTTVALAGDATSKPSRFSCVRRRSVEQEESGRTSTLEAYILLALELGEPTEACEALDGYLGDLVDALEFGKTAKPSIKAARASQ